MNNIEKIIMTTDAVLDCIPIVSTITNGAHLLYKLAHKVDIHNPVVPGLKTSLKIHSLSKDNFSCYVGLVPVLGNIKKIIDLVWWACIVLPRGFDFHPTYSKDSIGGDYLIRAMHRNNKDLVLLCLQKGQFNNPEKANSALLYAAENFDRETFKYVLSLKKWDAEILLVALGCSPTPFNEENENSIFDYWNKQAYVLNVKNNNEISEGISALNFIIKKNRSTLITKMIGILPENIPFSKIKPILLCYSCPHNKSFSSALTEENRNALIAKSSKPNLAELHNYYALFTRSTRYVDTAEDYPRVHFDIFMKLLDQAKLRCLDVERVIIDALSVNEFSFIDQIITKYEKQLLSCSKIKILKKIPHFYMERLAFWEKVKEGCLLSEMDIREKRTKLFAAWIDKWKKDISLNEASELYTDMSNWNGRIHPDGSYFRNLIASYQKILVETFPGCDTPSQQFILLGDRTPSYNSSSDERVSFAQLATPLVRGVQNAIYSRLEQTNKISSRNAKSSV